MAKENLYRKIPKVDVILADNRIQKLIETYGRSIVMDAVREETDHLRKQIRSCTEETQAQHCIEQLYDKISAYVENMCSPNMKTVINGTGTILHTNLGRAPISEVHAEKIKEIVTGYSNLEYNLAAGKRGERYAHFEQLLCKITGAEAAMAVNNNAAAVLLILSSLAKGGEVIVSRGELIEIGGKFRIPDVMEQSGASLVEVGTTNKTHYSDYEDAVTEDTKAFLKVHTSNYRIVGFTESLAIADLKPLSEETGIPIIEDLGSGVLVDLSKYGLTYEPTVQDSIQNGADVVCFSGDKLLGGPQAGIIIGKKKYIDLMKKNQLTRALRIDKFTACALELVLQEYLEEETAVKNIPVLRMMQESVASVTNRAQQLMEQLKETIGDGADVAIEACESQIGGGSLPLERIQSMAVTIAPVNHSVAAIDEAMRHLPIPIIPRTVNDKIYLDVRTIENRQFERIVASMEELLA